MKTIERRTIYSITNPARQSIALAILALRMEIQHWYRPGDAKPKLHAIRYAIRHLISVTKAG